MSSHLLTPTTLVLSTAFTDSFAAEGSTLTTNPLQPEGELSGILENNVESISSLVIERIKVDNYLGIVKALDNPTLKRKLEDFPSIAINQLHANGVDLSRLWYRTKCLKSLAVDLAGPHGVTDYFIEFMKFDDDGLWNWNQLACLKVVAPLEQHQRLQDMATGRGGGLDFELFIPHQT